MVKERVGGNISMGKSISQKEESWLELSGNRREENGKNQILRMEVDERERINSEMWRLSWEETAKVQRESTRREKRDTTRRWGGKERKCRKREWRRQKLTPHSLSNFFSSHTLIPLSLLSLLRLLTSISSLSGFLRQRRQ